MIVISKRSESRNAALITQDPNIVQKFTPVDEHKNDADLGNAPGRQPIKYVAGNSQEPTECDLGNKVVHEGRKWFLRYFVYLNGHDAMHDTL